MHLCVLRASLIVAIDSGLLGQTFDCDELAVHGRRDSYETLDDGRATATRHEAGGIDTTRAQAEGALQGHFSDYRVASPFATNFAVSRFNASGFVGPRNATQLHGGRSRRLARRLDSCTCTPPTSPSLPPPALPS